MSEAKPSAWVALSRILVHFDKSKVAPWVALRNAIGIATPLALAVALGNPAAGTVAATGALNVSLSDGSDPYFRRGGRMLTATVMGAIAVVVGALLGSNHLFGIVLVTGWAFSAGMLVALDNAAGDIGLISLVTLIVFSAQPMTPEHATYAGLLALGGGLLQTLLSLAFWPLRRHEPENRVVGELYMALAKLAGAPVNASEPPPVTGEISVARKMLSGIGRARSNQAERYWSLVSQAERIRLSLLMITRLRARLQREPDTETHTRTIDRARTLAAQGLRQIGGELLAGSSAVIDSDSLRQLSQLADDYRETERETKARAVQVLATNARFQLDALAGQLRSALELAASSTPAGRRVFEQRQAQRPWQFRVAGSVAILRANLSLRSAAFRHAVRLAVCVGFGDWIGRSLQLDRSYWMPMTVAIILKPDFTATFSRGVLRLAGTAIGLLLATLLFHLLPLTHASEVLLLGVVAFVMRCYGPANYGIFVTAISSLVVLLFALIGIAPMDVVASRATSTVAGGFLALAIYAVWPTWESRQVPETLALLLDAYRDYFRAVREAYVRPDIARDHDVDTLRLAGRVARTNLEGAAERLRSEPGVDGQTMELLNAMMASSHRFAHAVMALETVLTRSSSATARPQFVAFANDVELTLYLLASVLRGSPLEVSELPDLRARHHALVHAGDALTERHALVNVEADRMTNSLNTFSAQLAQWLGSVAFSPVKASSQ